MSLSQFQIPSYATSYIDLRSSPSFSSSDLSPSTHEHAPGGCFRHNSRSSVVLRTGQMVQITIVSFSTDKLVYSAQIQRGPSDTIYERGHRTTHPFENVPHVRVVPPMSLYAADKAVVSAGIEEPIAVPGDMPWALEGVVAARNAFYCSVYLDDDGVYCVTEAWGWGSFLIAGDTPIYSPAAWFGPAEVIYVGRADVDGCSRLQCRLETGHNIVLEVHTSFLYRNTPLPQGRLVKKISALFSRRYVAFRKFRGIGTFNHFRPSEVEPLDFD
ncbi:hypothetical protein B0H16DRAFT_1733651 [Mycena metata]|uniref:Uncharacterized protein n=1 Tax=Mycena metata TaxID=1033252 RepID=A0AAD7HZH1_9AGAR|nr:hypothetical protein B0H16DRAFT_1733651 [Mycena metata]